MSSDSRRQKLYEELNGRHCEDRLTNLPCSLKTKILSCLPTKDAVKTSILSTQWMTSWTSVTNLDFDDKIIRSRDDTLLTHAFINFVNRVLLLHDKSCLQRFRMECYECYSGSLINSWIAAVVRFNIKEIAFSVSVVCPDVLSADIFLCKTLVVLDLYIRCRLDMPASVCLPVLKTLHLSKTELYDDCSIIRLLSGCPVLEELQLYRCIGKDVCVINIISSSLTSLTMDYLPYGNNCQYRIIIDTPALKYLSIMDYKAQGYLIKDLNHLVKANVVVIRELFFGDCKPITEFFTGISQVQNLILSHETLKAICSSDLVLPCFRNLKYMKLDTSHYHNFAYFNGWSCLHKLLENSPCLETLDLHLGSIHEAYLSDNLTGESSCFLSHLKVINIVGFEGLESEMDMVQYFLENGKALEKLTIDYKSNSTEGDATFQRRLMMMPRSSAVCKVELCATIDDAQELSRLQS